MRRFVAQRTCLIMLEIGCFYAVLAIVAIATMWVWRVRCPKTIRSTYWNEWQHVDIRSEIASLLAFGAVTWQACGRSCWWRRCHGRQ